MTKRKRILTTLQGGIPDRVGKYDQYWPETIERWRKEGLPREAVPREFFGADDISVVTADASLGFKTEVLKETSSEIIRRLDEGFVIRTLKGPSATPQFLDFPVKTGDDWKSLRERLEFRPERLEALRNACEKVKPSRPFVALHLTEEPFNATWPRHGFEQTMMDILAEPEWMHEMFRAHTDLILRILEEVKRKALPIDGFWGGGDLAYKNGLLLSPETMRKMILPYMKEVHDLAHEFGWPVLYHTDGNLGELLPLLIETGIDAIQPIEAKAGNDVRDLKEKYAGKVTLFGNIDVQVLSEGNRARIEAEIRGKLAAAKVDGGYIYHSDHSIPPTVSLEAYQFAMECVERCGKY